LSSTSASPRHHPAEARLRQPYLRAFVIARINPLRWIKGEPPPLEEVLKTMREPPASSIPTK